MTSNPASPPVRRAALALCTAIALAAALATAPAPAAAAKLRLARLSLPLPAAPASVLPVDLDHDGARDLLVFLVYTHWGEKVVEESMTMEGFEGLMEVMTIVPALLDRRELRIYRGDGRGGYTPTDEALPMPLSVHSLVTDGDTVLALTDDGVAEIAWAPESSTLTLVPRIAARSRLAGTGVFLPELELLADLTGDGRPELLFPAADRLQVYSLGTGADGWTALGDVALPPAPDDASPLAMAYPLPEARDVDGDRVADLVWRDPEEGWKRPWVARGTGGGRFTAPRAPLAPLDEASPDAPETAWFGDLDGDGRAEVVTEEVAVLPEDAGMRAEIRDAEAPKSTVRVFATTGALAPAPAPRASFPVEGHVFMTGGDSDVQLPGGFRDLDGDGRLDLVAMTLGISVTRLLGGLALGRVTLPLGFNLWCQAADGTFRPVTGLDLSGRLRFDIGEMELRNMPSFAGDFDGDGRTDFVQLGRGKKVTIHTGAPGCRFPSTPDLTVDLKQEPAHMDLVRVRDLDGDGRADLMVVQLGESPEAGVTAPARLDLYLSAGESR
jgi:hypothetical protein